MLARSLGIVFLELVLWGSQPVVAQRPAQVQARIDALPVIARLEDGRTHFVLRGHLSRQRADEMQALARAVVRDVQRRFVGVGRGAGAPPPPVDVCLFDDERAYTELAIVTWSGSGPPSNMGFYVPGARLILANLRRAVGNLRHEMVHPMLGDHFRAIPPWLNEGLAALYGTSRLSGDRFEFLVNYRLRPVRAAIARRSLPTLTDIAASSAADLYGENGATFYGTARYLLLYLDALGRLDEFYAEMQRESPTVERQTQLLQRYIDYEAFLAWTRALRMNQPAPRPAR